MAWRQIGDKSSPEPMKTTGADAYVCQRASLN